MKITGSNLANLAIINKFPANISLNVMTSIKQDLYPNIHRFIEARNQETDQIPAERKSQLERLANYIRSRLESGETVQLNYICTHNSRRSHISQIWSAVAATYFGLDSIENYSGGTEATAFNPRAVAAMKRAGLQIDPAEGNNPQYQVTYSDRQAALSCFSKTYDHPDNPQKDFAAIMTCSDADANCPFIPGAAFRLPLTYEDPKEADDTPEESARYDERVRQIARELLYAYSRV